MYAQGEHGQTAERAGRNLHRVRKHNRMAAVVLLLISTCGLTNRRVYAEDIVEIHSSYTEGRRYDFRLSEAALQQSPSWSVTQDFPPLAPGKAVTLSSKALLTFVSNHTTWHLRGICLEQSAYKDKWFYAVEYEPGDLHQSHCIDCLSELQTLTIPVLMDGTVVKPIVFDAPK